MNPYDIIYHFYPKDTPLRRLLILHSEKVRDKAFAILREARLIEPSAFADIDEQLINDGALLHDIGIGKTNAPGILCEGTEPYILHGTIGAEMLRSLQVDKGASREQEEPLSNDKGVFGECSNAYLESLARVCERHTGSGLTAEDILAQGLPISPARDLIPETLEEQLVCLADKFYSKSGDASAEKQFDRVRRSMMKFGPASIDRFNALCETFYIK